MLILKRDNWRLRCENGWLKFNGHCYKKSSSKATWANAKLECQKMCSYLVEIESKEESDWLATTFLDNANCKSDPFFDCTAWTGGNDLDTEGQYKWDHSNTLMSFTNWHYHEPSLGNPNQALNKDCIDMLRDGVWNDRPFAKRSQEHFLSTSPIAIGFHLFQPSTSRYGRLR
uniref:Aggrecan core protein n=1 Tax=Magallana gigas TaxID=29159 RepID=K1QRK2_MAGGI